MLTWLVWSLIKGIRVCRLGRWVFSFSILWTDWPSIKWSRLSTAVEWSCDSMWSTARTLPSNGRQAKALACLSCWLCLAVCVKCWRMDLPSRRCSCMNNRLASYVSISGLCCNLRVVPMLYYWTHQFVVLNAQTTLSNTHLLFPKLSTSFVHPPDLPHLSSPPLTTYWGASSVKLSTSVLYRQWLHLVSGLASSWVRRDWDQKHSSARIICHFGLCCWLCQIGEGDPPFQVAEPSGSMYPNGHWIPHWCPLMPLHPLHFHQPLTNRRPGIHQGWRLLTVQFPSWFG